MSAPTVLEVHLAEHDAPGLAPGACPRCRAGFRTCRRKRKYGTNSAAAEHALGFNLGNNWERPLVAYRCAYCTLWHLTTARTPAQLKRVRRQRRRLLGVT